MENNWEEVDINSEVVSDDKKKSQIESSTPSQSQSGLSSVSPSVSGGQSTSSPKFGEVSLTPFTEQEKQTLPATELGGYATLPEVEIKPEPTKLEKFNDALGKANIEISTLQKQKEDLLKFIDESSNDASAIEEDIRLGQETGSEQFLSNAIDAGNASYAGIEEAKVLLANIDNELNSANDRKKKLEAGIRNIDDLRSFTGEQPSFKESISNTLSNIGNALEGVLPRMSVAFGSTLNPTMPQELQRQLDYEKLSELEKGQKQTRGIIESMEKADFPGFVAAGIDAVGSIVSSAVPGLASGGATLYTDAVGQNVYDYNTAKAKEKGVTVRELFDSGEGEVLIPTTLGVLSGALETWGLKGIPNAMNEKMFTEGGKKLAKFLTESSKEGVSEIIDVGLSTYNKAYAETQDTKKAAAIAVDAMISKEGLEAGLKGFGGAAGVAGAGRLSKGLYKKIVDSKGDITKLEGTLDAVEAAVSVGSITPEKAQEITTDINNKLERDQRIPDKVTNLEARIQSNELLKTADELRGQLEKSDPLYKKEIEAQIEAIGNDLLEIAKTNKPLDKTYNLKVEETKDNRITTEEDRGDSFEENGVKYIKTEVLPLAIEEGVRYTYTPESDYKKEVSERGKERENILKDFENVKETFRVTDGVEKEAKGLGFHSGTEQAAQEREKIRKAINKSDSPLKVVKTEKLKNPVSVSKDLGFMDYETVKQGLITDGIITKEEAATTKTLEDIRGILQSKGYDGIIYRNGVEDKGSISQIAFPKETVPPSSKQGEADLGEGTPQVSKREELEKNLEDAKQQFLKSSRSSLSSGGMQSISDFAKYVKAWVDLNGYKVKELIRDLRQYFGDSEYLKQFKTDEDLEKHILDVRQEKIEKESKKIHPVLKKAQDWAFAEGRTVGAIEQAKQDNKEFQKEKKSASKEAQRLIDNAYDFGFAEGGASGKLEQAKIDEKEKEKLLKDFEKEKSKLSKEEQKRVDNAYDFGVADGRSKGDWMVNQGKMLSDYVNNNKDFKAKINKSPSAKTVLFNKLNALMKATESKDATRQKKLNDVLDYLDKLEKDGDYQNKLDQLKKNIKGALRRKHITSMQNKVKEFLSINPNKLSKESFEEYVKAVKELNDDVPNYEKTNKIFDKIINESKVDTDNDVDIIQDSEKLKDYVDNFKNMPVTNVDEYRAFMRKATVIKRKAETLKSMMPDGADVSELDSIIDKINKLKEKNSKEYSDLVDPIKNDLINEIRGYTPDKSAMTETEKELVDEFENMTKDGLMKLDLGELEDLAKVSERMNQGYVPIYPLADIVVNYKVANNLELLEGELSKADEKKWYKNDLKFSKEMGGSELSFIEHNIGLKTGGPLYRKLVNPLLRRLSRSKIDLQKDIEQFHKDLGKKEVNGRDSRRVAMLMHMLYESNIENRDIFGEILKTKGFETAYKEKDVVEMKKFYNELLKDYSTPEGTLDIQKIADTIRNNISKIMTPDQIKLFNAANNAFANVEDKQRFINEYKGLPFEKRKDYIPTNRFGNSRQIQITKGGVLQPKIAASAGKEKVTEKISAIDIDIESLVLNHLLEVERDYNVTQGLKLANKTMSELKKSSKVDESLSDKINNELRGAVTYEYSRMENDILEKLWKKTMNANITRMLLTGRRILAETLSTLGGLPTRVGKKFFTKESAKMFIPKTNEREAFNKLLEDTNSTLLVKETGRDISAEETSIRRKGKLERVANKAIGITEFLLQGNIWMPTFLDSFKEITGKKFNVEAYLNDPYYLKSNKEAILDAASDADVATKQVVGPGIKGEGRRLVQITPELMPQFLQKRFGWPSTKVYSESNNLFGKAMGMLTNYMWRENKVAIEMGLRQLIAGGPQGRIKGGANFTSVAISYLIYAYSNQLIRAIQNIEFGNDEEKEEAEETIESLKNPDYFLEIMKQQALAIAQSKFSNAGRIMGFTIANIYYDRIDDNENLSESEKKEAKEKTKRFIKETYNREPINRKSESESMISQVLLPQVDALNDQVYAIFKGDKKTADYKEFAEWVSSIWGKVERGEDLTSSEEEAYKMFNHFMTDLNLLMMATYGQSLPKTDVIFSYFRGGKPSVGTKKKKGDGNSEDPFDTTEKDNTIEENDPFSTEDKSEKENKKDPFDVD